MSTAFDAAVRSDSAAFIMSDAATRRARNQRVLLELTQANVRLSNDWRDRIVVSTYTLNFVQVLESGS